MSIRRHAIVWITSILSVFLVSTTTVSANASTSAPAVPVPAPGHSSVWTMPVENTTDADVAVWLAVTEETAKLPLVLVLSDAEGRVVLGPTRLDELEGSEARIGGLAAGERTHYEGRVSMPRHVGNDVQGASQTTEFRFSLVAADESSPGGTLPDGLAQTGFLLSWLLPLALTLILAGVVISRRRRKTEIDEREERATS